MYTCYMCRWCERNRPIARVNLTTSTVRWSSPEAAFFFFASLARRWQTYVYIYIYIYIYICICCIYIYIYIHTYILSL